MATTVCPKCKASFDSHLNLAYTIERRYAPYWFFDALKQYKNFNHLKCPNCGFLFINNNLKVLFFFKSLYTAILVPFIFVLVFLLGSLIFFFTP